jgi:hypothetical protein
MWDLRQLQVQGRVSAGIRDDNTRASTLCADFERTLGGPHDARCVHVQFGRVDPNLGQRDVHELRSRRELDTIQNLYKDKSLALVPEKRAVQIFRKGGKVQLCYRIGYELSNQFRNPFAGPE